MLAHVFGLPVEETALSLAPVATVLGGIAVAHLRRGDRRERPLEPQGIRGEEPTCPK